MKPGPLDLPTIWRGCDYGPVILKWKDQNGDPIDLDGWHPKAHSLNIDLHPIVTDNAQGITVISMDRVETAYLKLGVEKWDWIWERITPSVLRYPPFLSGRVPIREPQTVTPVPQPLGPPPPNDSFSNAITIHGDTGSIEGTNVNSTRQPGEPPGTNSVWYNWTPNRHWRAIMGLGMNWLNIGIYTGDAVNDLTHIATSSGDPSAVTWLATVGVTYRIRIYKATRLADFNLNWDLQPPG